MLKIGLSACFLYADPNRGVFSPKTLQYLEQSAAHWLMSAGAMPFLIPSPANAQPARAIGVSLADYARELDALVLEAGSDLSPTTYGETPLKPEWSGDRGRDVYEIALLREFVALGKPVLGLCRGAQLINVAFGGTLYQDIATQRPEAQAHRDRARYDQILHDISIVPESGLARLYPNVQRASVNTVHHQGVKDLARALTVEAWSEPDRMVEAVRWQGDSYVFGTQWHPEFHDPARADLLDSKPLLDDFLAHAQARKQPSKKKAHA
jgi:putative glutamine amidotransferase